MKGYWDLWEQPGLGLGLCGLRLGAEGPGFTVQGLKVEGLGFRGLGL